MVTRPVNIPTYTKNVSQIQSGLSVRAAPHVNNFTLIETTLASLESVAEDHDERFKGIERRSFVKYFDDAKVTTGTNTITIGGGATILNTIDSAGGYTAITGFADSGAISVSGITSGVIWAISNTLLYQATNDDPASRPTNGYRVTTFTNSGGVVTPIPKTFENAIDTDNHQWEGTNVFRGPVTFRDSLRVTGNPTFDKGILPVNYHDVRIEYTSASTVTIKAGSRCRSSDNTEDIVFASDQTVNLASSGAGGLDTGSEASNTHYYLYAIKNVSTGAVSAVLSTTNESSSGSITLPSGYTKKRQIRFSLRNDGSSNIVPFWYLSGKVHYAVSIGDYGVVGDNNVLSSGTATSYTDISCSSLIPPISKVGLFKVLLINGGGNTYGQIRPKGSSINGHTLAVTSVAALAGNVINMQTDSSQALQYKCNLATVSMSVWVMGYEVTEVL